jgi:Xaa-Pro aminopeptidase
MMATTYENRRDLLRRSMDASIEALLVTSAVNVRYLTGFTGSNGGVLIRANEGTRFATDGRYTTQAAAQVPDLECIEARAVGPALLLWAAENGIRRVGIEAGQVTLDAHDGLLAAADGTVELVPTAGLVEQLRAVKDEGELALLARACEITTAAFETVVDRLKPGITERDVAWSLQAAIRDLGGDGLAFDSIVAFGAASAVPHHQPTDRQLEHGDLVKLDFGAQLGGYHADMTRTVVAGRAATWQRDLYLQVETIQAKCRAAVRPGVLPAALDRHAREAITATGHEVAHGLGHGVGLQIHEQPMLVARSTAPALAVGTTLTIEPGIYLPNLGGVRIEDTMVVTAQGAEALTASPRELMAVG